MEIALPDYRERLGGAIHDVSSFTFKTLNDRMKEIFPGGFVLPKKVGHVVVPFVVNDGNLVAHPMLPIYKTVDGVPQGTDFPKHSSICTEIIDSGVKTSRIEALFGYVWQNTVSSNKEFTMALTTHDFTEANHVDAISNLTSPNRPLSDHVVYVVTEPGWVSETMRAVDGRVVDVTPASLPEDHYDRYSKIPGNM